MTPEAQHAGRPAGTGGPGHVRPGRIPPGDLSGGPPGDGPDDPPAGRTATVALDGAGDRERLGRATGTADPYLRDRLINDMMGCLALANGAGPREAEAAARAALAALESLAPADAADGMLAVQAVGCHAAAMDCLRRAARGDGPPAARDWNLRHAVRLMALYERQIAALDRSREARWERRSRDPAYHEAARRPTASAEPPASARPHLADAAPPATGRETGHGTGIDAGRGTRPENGGGRLKDRLLGGAASASKGSGGTAPGGAPPPGRSP